MHSFSAEFALIHATCYHAHMAGKIDLSEELTSAIESVVEGWYPEGNIDWDNFLDRVENYSDVDLGTDMNSPLIRAVKKYAKAYQRL